MNTTLYINPLTPNITIIISDGESIIERSLAKNLDTASAFPKLLVELVDQYKIREIWCVSGPGPFTLMRVITLAINALTYTRDIGVKYCHFFDLIDTDRGAIIEANPREYLMRGEKELIIVPKANIPNGIYEGIFGETLSTEGVKLIQYIDSWDRISDIFENKESTIRISPIYFKPPHITGREI